MKILYDIVVDAVCFFIAELIKTTKVYTTFRAGFVLEGKRVHCYKYTQDPLFLGLHEIFPYFPCLLFCSHWAWQTLCWETVGFVLFCLQCSKDFVFLREIGPVLRKI